MTPHQRRVKEARVALSRFWAAQGEIDVGTGVRTDYKQKMGKYERKDNSERLGILHESSPLAAAVASMINEDFGHLARGAGVGIGESSISSNTYHKSVRQQLGDAILDVIEKNEP